MIVGNYKMCNEVYENKQNELVILAYKVIQVRLEYWEVKWGENSMDTVSPQSYKGVLWYLYILKSSERVSSLCQIIQNWESPAPL